MLFAFLAAIATAYQLAAMAACWRFMRQKRFPGTGTPGISVLKPIRGEDDLFWEAMSSHAHQDYPDFELLFGAADASDEGALAVGTFLDANPRLDAKLLITTARMPNRKVGVLTELEKSAMYQLLLVNDSDIRVPPNYLRDIVAPLADPSVGLVTCLYRATAHTFAGKMEALGISTDFAPSVLVAPLVGVNEFGLGSTLLFRRADLEAIGGFEAIADYLADDYQLAKRITTGLHKRAWLSHVIVDTSLQAESWRDVWLHQVRWHRTIRVSRFGGYLGLPVTFAAIWGAAAFVAGFPAIGAIAISSRYAMALSAGVLTLHCPIAGRYWLLTPLRDLFGAAVWLAGLFGNRVRWRDRNLRLTRDGRIEAE